MQENSSDVTLNSAHTMRCIEWLQIISKIHVLGQNAFLQLLQRVRKLLIFTVRARTHFPYYFVNTSSRLDGITTTFALVKSISPYKL